MSQPRVVTGAAIAWVATGLITFAALFTTWFTDDLTNRTEFRVSIWGNASGGERLADHSARLGVLLLLGSGLLLMAGVFAVRREPLLERCAGIAGTSSVLAVGIYMTVFDVTSGYSWFEGTVEEGNTWLLVLSASLIALGCAHWVLKSDRIERHSTTAGAALAVTGPGGARGVPFPWVACAVLVVLLSCGSVFRDYYSVSGPDDNGPSGYLLEHFDDNNFSPGLTYVLLLVPSGLLILWGLLRSAENESDLVRPLDGQLPGPGRGHHGCLHSRAGDAGISLIGGRVLSWPGLLWVYRRRAPRIARHGCARSRPARQDTKPPGREVIGAGGSGMSPTKGPF